MYNAKRLHNSTTDKANIFPYDCIFCTQKNQSPAVLEALTGVLDKTFIGWIRDIHPDLFIKSSLDEHRFQCWLDEDRFHCHFTVGKLQGHSVKASLIWFHPNPILVWYLSTWITIHTFIYLSINIFFRITVFKKVPLIEGFFQKLFLYLVVWYMHMYYIWAFL